MAIAIASPSYQTFCGTHSRGGIAVLQIEVELGQCNSARAIIFACAMLSCAYNAETVAAFIQGARRPLVLTGAGMSAESGVPTFRGHDDSLWARFDPQQLATWEAWRADPALVWGRRAWSGSARRCRPPTGRAPIAPPMRPTWCW
ncbi:Sir2 family NAD-dependent protein deacetylase [Xanthomonas translucens]|uniref:Sir2 family NAD-dependent protein deacetylase n=1 Tax=Xanthomonas campestris pv. translucens TaxID=343 RepID=UPI003CCD94F9